MTEQSKQKVRQVQKTEPLGLPKGSVRSIITLMLVSVACMIWASKGGLPETLKTALMAALAFYFGMRKDR